jgi:hypothetical protein
MVQRIPPLEAALTDTWTARGLEHLRDGGATAFLVTKVHCYLELLTRKAPIEMVILHSTRVGGDE